MKLTIIIFLTIGIIMILFVNFINERSQGPNTITSSNEIITSNISDMIPSLNGEPLKVEEESESENHIRAGSTFSFGYNVIQLNYDIYKLSSIDEAYDKYDSVKKSYSDYKNTRVYLGNDGFGIEKRSSSTVVFRKANIVIIVQLDGQYTSLEQTISYAKRVRFGRI